MKYLLILGLLAVSCSIGPDMRIKDIRYVCENVCENNRGLKYFSYSIEKCECESGMELPTWAHFTNECVEKCSVNGGRVKKVIDYYICQCKNGGEIFNYCRNGCKIDK